MSIQNKPCKKLQIGYLVLGIVTFVDLVITIIFGSINVDNITDEIMANNFETASNVIWYMLTIASMLAAILISVMFFLVRKETKKGMLAFYISLTFPVLIIIGTMITYFNNVPHLNQILSQIAIIGLFVAFEIFINLIIKVDNKMRYWINSIMLLTALAVVFGLLSTFIKNNSDAVFGLQITYTLLLCASFFDSYYVLHLAKKYIGGSEEIKEEK